jgi:hypothetical protein
MFDNISLPESRPTVLLKRAVLVLLAACLVTGFVSAYRAYYQVRWLELRLAESVLREGSVVEVAVSGSGRTSIDVRVELIQGTHSETLSVRSMRGNEWAAFDPRPRTASQSVVLTPEQLSRFRNGAASVRATATGRPQWTRLPPPTVREAAVEVRRD